MLELRPHYPRRSRLLGEQGVVLLRVSFNRDGVVESARVMGSSGFERLDEAALEAARAARTGASALATARERDLRVVFRLDDRRERD
jgi:TonB family protein